MRHLRQRWTKIIGLMSIGFAIALLGWNQIAVARAGFPVPQNGQAYFGVQLDWSSDTVDAYAARLGHTPAIVGRYVNFPLSSSDDQAVNLEVQTLAAHHEMLMLTLEPWPGLTAINAANLKSLTKRLKAWNSLGVPVLVRFAHEMNGSWYPWAQQPGRYVSTFRQVANAVHQAPSSAMLWSPNDGGGYPFAGGPYEAKPGTADFAALDTNHDGQLTMSDDPFTPYYPGDSYVDWVGLSLYHFGSTYPWGANVVPASDKFVGKLTGTYQTSYIDETAIPNFYDLFARRHNKPMAISETSALYNASRSDGASNLDIKSAWWQQLFDPSLAATYPQLKMIVWFEYQKQEQDTGTALIDWRVTADPTIDAAFKAALPSRLIYAH